MGRSGRAIGIAGLIVAIWLVGAAGITAQEETFAVQGRVVNGTQEGGEVSGLTVVLHRDTENGVLTRDAVTDEAGSYSFDEIPLDTDSLYGVSVVYQGAIYAEAVEQSAGGVPGVTLTVYEAVSEAGVLKALVVSTLLSQVDGATQTVRALDIVRLVNDSDRTYVPGADPMQLLRFGLPPGAFDLSVDTDLLGVDVIQVETGFGLVGGVPPGEHEVLYSYAFPYPGEATSFVKSLLYGATELRVLAPEGMLSLSSPELGEGQAVEIGGRSYTLVEGSSLPPGSRISVELAGLPAPTLGGRVESTLGKMRLEVAAPAGLGAFMAVLIAFALWRRAVQRRAESVDRP